MRKIILVMLFFSSVLWAQEKTLKGKVSDSSGEPLPEANVKVVGGVSAFTDVNGNYSVTVKEGDKITFSFTDLDDKTIKVGKQTVLNVTLSEGTTKVDDVIVTALGIKKEKKALAYSAQEIDGSELEKAASTNFTNSITGKVANLNITQSSSGVGGANRIIFRGSGSLAQSNQPLIVIDGTPIINVRPNTQSTLSFANNNSAWGGAPDGGDDLSNINPDDIANISFLKGASAAALYGSAGQNGAIMITTKSAKDGRQSITLHSSTAFLSPVYKPKFQNEYGRKVKSSNFSWSYKKLDESQKQGNPAEEFYRTGFTTTNGISLSSGVGDVKTYFSYSNTSAEGIVETNRLNRHNLNLRLQSKFLKDKLSLDAKTTYINSTIYNTFLPGIYLSQITGVYLFPRDRDFNQYRRYQNPDGKQNWHFIEDKQQNPYWILNKDPNETHTDKFFTTASLRYNILKGLDIQARGTLGRTQNEYQQKRYKGTSTIFAGKNGGWQQRLSNTTNLYGDLLLTYNTDFLDKFGFSGVLGSSIQDSKTTGQLIDTQTTNLIVPDLFNISNLESNLAVKNPIYSRSQKQSAFGSLEFSYDKAIYLTVTGRNDWSSTLSKDNRSYFYPSVGLSAIISKLLELPTSVFLKVRGSLTSIGNDVSPFISSDPPGSPIERGQLVKADTAPFTDLEPERSDSYEIGMDFGIFKNFVTGSFTYYHTNTKNQLFKAASDAGAQYAFRYLNGGLIVNKGFEGSLSFNTSFGEVKWQPTINFSTNQNEVKKLAEGFNEFIITPEQTTTFRSAVRVGGSIGDVYSKKLRRDDQGRLIIDNSIEEGGKRINSVNVSDEFVKVANPNPDFRLSLGNNINYRNFSLSFLIDGSFGGEVVSLTQAMMDKYGISVATGKARDNGGVAINGINEKGEAITKMDPKNFYNTQGGRDAALGEYVYDATNIRLRELNINYQLPKSIFKHSFINRASIGVFGRNLFFIYKPAPFDAEIVASSGNGLQGGDLFNLPTTRSIGFNLKLQF